MARDSAQPWFKDADPADAWGTDDTPRGLIDDKAWHLEGAAMTTLAYVPSEHEDETRDALLAPGSEVEIAPADDFDPLEFGLASY